MTAVASLALKPGGAAIVALIAPRRWLDGRVKQRGRRIDEALPTAYTRLGAILRASPDVASALADPTMIAGIAADWATFVGAAETAGWEWRLDSPTTDTTFEVVQAKMGSRFDVIRKRANAGPESYTTFAAS